LFVELCLEPRFLEPGEIENSACRVSFNVKHAWGLSSDKFPEAGPQKLSLLRAVRLSLSAV
jgi:hypothetical protein